MNVTENTPISFLTVKELKEILSTVVQPAETVQVQTNNPEDYAYGYLGLRKLFNCSHTTAWRLKTTVLKPAIIQHGRMFQVKKETALQLVAENSKGGRRG